MRRQDLIDRLLDIAARTCGLSAEQVDTVEKRLRGEFGGDRIAYLARVGRRQIAKRNERILNELARGRTLREVAALVGCSAATVCEVRKSALRRSSPANVQRSR